MLSIAVLKKYPLLFLYLGYKPTSNSEPLVRHKNPCVAPSYPQYFDLNELESTLSEVDSL